MLVRWKPRVEALPMQVRNGPSLGTGLMWYSSEFESVCRVRTGAISKVNMLVNPNLWFQSSLYFPNPGS